MFFFCEEKKGQESFDGEMRTQGRAITEVFGKGYGIVSEWKRED